MSVVCDRDEELRIENLFFAMDDLIDSHRIHVVDDHPVMNLMVGNTHVATKISSDYLMANLLPLSRSIETLVDVALEAEGRLTDNTPE